MGSVSSSCVRGRSFGELDLRQSGLLTDTYLSFGNVAEGGVAVEPEAVFHGWR